MQNSQNKKALQIGLFVLVAIVVLGVGYAAISAVNLIINGNATASVDQNNFKVHFTQAQAISGSTGASGTSTIDSQDDTKATFDVTGLTKVGDYAEAVYTVRNDSNGVGAEITLNLESSNTEYFKVTETILDNKLQAGDSTTASVRVEMIKTPINDAVSTSITATLTASPLEDAQASGGEEISVIGTKPYVYTINNTSDIYFDTDISDGIRTFSSFTAATAEFGYPAALAHIIETGKVKDSYIAFEKNNKVYYLRTRINERNQTSKPVYDENSRNLREAFGQENCQEYYNSCGDNCNSIECSSDDLSVYAYAEGDIRVGGTNWMCYSGANGFVRCVN